MLKNKLIQYVHTCIHNTYLQPCICSERGAMSVHPDPGDPGPLLLPLAVRLVPGQLGLHQAGGHPAADGQRQPLRQPPALKQLRQQTKH